MQAIAATAKDSMSLGDNSTALHMGRRPLLLFCTNDTTALGVQFTTLLTWALTHMAFAAFRLAHM